MSRVPQTGPASDGDPTRDPSRSGSALTAKVAAVANRLRLLQLDFADDAPDARRDALSEEIERALAQIVPDEREEFLRAVQDMFPTWDSNVQVAPKAEEAAGASRVDERELKSSSFLVERLVELSGRMSDEERTAVTGRLVKSGLAPPPANGSFPEAAAERIRARLSIPAATSLDAARTVELAGMLVELALSLDQVVWNTWKQVAPRSELRRTGDLARTVGRFATGDQDVPRGQVKQDLERVRQLTAALISSVAQAGRQFAQKHQTRFSVDAIKDAAGPGTMLKPQAVRCWEKYVELAGPLDSAALENELLQSIAKYAEDLVKGINR